MTGPYAAAADTYWNAGWRGILPLPANKKHDPPKGYTGAGGAFPSYADIFTWAQSREGIGNVALRMPPNIIGIDVDNYGDKNGAQTLTLAEAANGPLPTTWRSTSRDDGTSGIYLYRIPEGLAWPGEVGPSIEFIQTRHRYCVVWPSLHPEGRTYRWISPDGLISTAVPDPDDLPLLPEEWINAYTGGEIAINTPRVEIKHADAIAWIASRPHATGAMCQRMTKALDQHSHDLLGSAHNSTRDATLRTARLAEEGHHGAVHALGKVRAAFIADATSANRGLLGTRRRTEAEAVYEFGDLVASAVGVVLGSPSGLLTCDCFGQLTGAIVPEKTPMATDGSVALDPLAEPAPVEEQVEAAEPAMRFKDGATFILDAPEKLPNIWGEDDESLWAAGEALMIVGPPGVGKTTLTGQIVRGLLGLQRTVLGLPVRVTERKVLYLAMDRPAQIARGLRRAFSESDRQTLADRLMFWEGPPPGDVAKHPAVLLTLAELADADVVVIDSVKDAAIGLSEDEVAAAYNRARQNCLAHGVEVLELHHMVKRGGGGSKPTELADVYGSAWLTAGAGSVLLLWGAAGDPIVQMIHLKQPAGEVGPWQLEHDHTRGTTIIFRGADVLQIVASYGHEGTTAAAVAHVMFENDSPSESEKKKAARKLQRLVDQGHLERFEKPRDVWTGGKPQHCYRAVTTNAEVNAAGSFTEPNEINAESMPDISDSRSKPNAEVNDANATTESMPQAPPFRKGGPAGTDILKSCKRCFRPTPEVILDTFDGVCGKCSHEQGVTK